MAAKKNNNPFIGASIALWRNEFAKDNESAPVLRGKITVKTTEGEYEVLADISLWQGKGGEKAPVLTGKISEVYVKPEQSNKPAF